MRNFLFYLWSIVFLIFLLWDFFSKGSYLSILIVSFVLVIVGLLRFKKNLQTKDLWSVQNVKEPLLGSTTASDFSEFFVRHKHIQTDHITGRIPVHFQFEHYGRTFKVVLLQKSRHSDLVLLITANFGTPGQFLLGDDAGVRSAIKKNIGISPERNSKSTDLLTSTPAIQRQLSRLKPLNFVLLNQTTSVAAGFINWDQYTPELISRCSSALLDLHHYAKRALTIKTVNVQSASPEAVCPYCKGEVSLNETRNCENCRAAHHSDCWTINNGCAIFGCSRPATIPQHPRVLE
jgi:hypothetical protein